MITRGCALVFFMACASTAYGQTASLADASAEEVAAGKRIFDAQCAWCHGADGVGGTGSSLQRTALRHARSDADLVSIVRNGVPGTEMPAFYLSMTDSMARRTAAYVRSLGRSTPAPLAGNREAGAAIYEAKGCQSCHVIAGRGNAVGPELTTIGALRGPAFLRESIVKPEAAHPRGYLVVRAIRRSGGEVRGIRVDEDAFWLHVRDAAGTLHTIEKKELANVERELNGTLMPSYASMLSPTELDDLVAYLAHQRGER
jgi:putative heme-binding domain-containing protein